MSLAISVVLLALAACSGGESAGTPTSQGSNAPVSQAESFLEPYLGTVSEFPVTVPLETLPTGKSVVFIRPNDPTALSYQPYLEDAMDLLGIKLTAIDAGTSAADFVAAANSAIQLAPDAIMLLAIDPAQVSGAIKSMTDAKIPVFGIGLSGAADYDMIQIVGDPWYELSGQGLANFVYLDEGDEADVTFYNLAELAYSRVLRDAFEAEFEALCPDCGFRSVDVPLATVGSTAPNQIVSDLEANPSTNYVVLSAGATGIGLPSALERAGIDVNVVDNAPTVLNLQYLRDGQEAAVFGFQDSVYIFTAADAVAKHITGQELDPGEQPDQINVSAGILRPEDVTFDPEEGWLPYPDYVDRFKTLWGLE